MDKVIRYIIILLAMFTVMVASGCGASSYEKQLMNDMQDVLDILERPAKNAKTPRDLALDAKEKGEDIGAVLIRMSEVTPPKEYELAHLYFENALEEIILYYDNRIKYISTRNERYNRLAKSHHDESMKWFDLSIDKLPGE